MGKMWQWAGSKWEICGSGQGLMCKMWQWTGSKWERCGSAQGLSGKVVTVDKV